VNGNGSDYETIVTLFHRLSVVFIYSTADAGHFGGGETGLVSRL
jgi:hypothetical protein